MALRKQTFNCLLLNYPNFSPPAEINSPRRIVLYESSFVHFKLLYNPPQLLTQEPLPVKLLNFFIFTDVHFVSPSWKTPALWRDWYWSTSTRALKAGLTGLRQRSVLKPHCRPGKMLLPKTHPWLFSQHVRSKWVCLMWLFKMSWILEHDVTAINKLIKMLLKTKRTGTQSVVQILS